MKEVSIIGSKEWYVLDLMGFYSWGRSQVFESEGAQCPKAMLVPFCLNKREVLNILLLLYCPKSERTRAT